jgi:hypothetical protein
MLIAKLEGGLGNQLFQWARVRHLSLKHNAPAFLDLSYFELPRESTPRNFSLDKFPFINYHTEIKLAGPSKPLETIADDFIFKEFNYQDNLNYYFDGYWQNEKYFKGSSDIIRRELAAPDEVVFRWKEIIGSCRQPVSLHVRRTDYLQFAHIHPPLPVNYYENALGLVSGYDSIIVFSDDIDWCKNNLPFSDMIFAEGQSDVEDLWMMSFCKHNIIANSSFSWWGAWLNSNANKTVIAPKAWFGPSSVLSAAEIVPTSWLTI